MHEYDTLIELEERHSGSLMAKRPTPPMVRGKGCWLWDAEDERYLDLTAAYGVASLGHCHPALAASLAEQAEILISCPGSLYASVRARFLEALAQVVPPHLTRFFLANSGAEAIEAALKIARLVTQRQGLVALRGSFHGRTTGALSLTWKRAIREPFLPLLDGVHFVEREDLEGLDAAVQDTTAALVLEVIQGEGGVHPLSAEYLQSAQSLCRERGALLIVDEIQTGFGRTGTWFAHPTLGIEPDLMALAKGVAGGVPLGVTCYTDAIAEALFPSAHASTFGGSPLACAAGLATLRTLQDGVVEQVPHLGRRLRELLEEGLRDCPQVREIRGRGLMVAVELRRKVAPVLHSLLEDHRVLALPAGSTVLRLLPPLVIDEEQLALGAAAIVKVLNP